MNVLEKREFIHSHLHQLDEKLLEELFSKMYSIICGDDPIVGYDLRSGEPLFRSTYRRELEKRNQDIEAGNFVSHEDVKKLFNTW